MISLSVPNFEGNEVEYVSQAVSQGWVSTGGPYVDKLEKVIADYTKMPGSVACQSGTAALHMALIECNVQQDDMVIVPTLTFIAAVNPVRYLNAQPVFMDCDDSLCIDPDKLELFCENECYTHDGVLVCKENGKKIKALIVVHVFGNLADMERIMDIASRFNLKVIEDATEALGTICQSGKYKGKMAGSIGDFGAYSFNGNKIITTGGGGMIISQDEKVLQHLKYMSTQSKDDPIFYTHHEIGYNYRMTNVQAAIGVAQMEELEEFIKRKNINYDIYLKELQDVEWLELLPFRENIRSNKWFYSLMINVEKIGKDIKSIVEALYEMGIQTRPIWGLIHEQKPYHGSINYKIEKATYYSSHILNIPCSTNITVEEIKIVCDKIKGLN